MDETDNRLDTLLEQVERLVKAAEQTVTLQRAILERLSTEKIAASVDVEIFDALTDMTPKNHVAMQLILKGCGNKDIAEHLGVAESGAKVHVRTVAKRLGVSTRSQVSAMLLPVMEIIPSESYEKMSGGLPKDWASKILAGEEDLWRGVYMGAD